MEERGIRRRKKSSNSWKGRRDLGGAINTNEREGENGSDFRTEECQRKGNNYVEARREIKEKESNSNLK